MIVDIGVLHPQFFIFSPIKIFCVKERALGIKDLLRKLNKTK